jgi:hypothetical protein
MDGQIALGMTDKIAIVGVAVSLLALVVAVWCVDLSLNTTLRVNTLIGIRDDVVKTLDQIEALLREVDDDKPLNDVMVQKISTGYWEAKHQFEVSHQKALVILSPAQIVPWSEAVPKVDAAYARFAEGLKKHSLNAHALNDFKAELYVALAKLEQIISRRLLHFYQRRLANELLESRQRSVRNIRETNRA